ncbi:hypothetical protein B0T26DRAFT_732765 [Lasiosphaeria miniovina]|uniref:Uncharacterized protein n=1 Tax=Lasiosphaeria miniovina TaxID=1954250 RepID=A0AA40DHX6_9PEZI|nr:uncharacterized protein B0T26DRAFT_732765 [Lasiosphaeria miniovina]KAK0703805.1 hypothetical protein B0T26DRAFT_732765 [Lasiosphaeria miniovina]
MFFFPVTCLVQFVSLFFGQAVSFRLAWGYVESGLAPECLSCDLLSFILLLLLLLAMFPIPKFETRKMHNSRESKTGIVPAQ